MSLREGSAFVSLRLFHGVEVSVFGTRYKPTTESKLLANWYGRIRRERKEACDLLRYRTRLTKTLGHINR